MAKTPLVIPTMDDLRVAEETSTQIQIIVDQIISMARRNLGPKELSQLEKLKDRLESLYTLETEKRTVLKTRVMAATRRGHHRAGIDLLEEKHEELGRMLAERKATYEPNGKQR